MEKSRVIYNGRVYVASAMKDGSLIVQNKRTGKGSRLVGENAPHWIDAIETAVDNKEKSFICKAMF